MTQAQTTARRWAVRAAEAHARAFLKEAADLSAVLDEGDVLDVLALSINNLALLADPEAFSEKVAQVVRAHTAYPDPTDLSGWRGEP